MKLSEHFELREFARTDPVPETVIERIQLLVDRILEPLRIAIQLPVVITSGWRAVAHNAAVGGVAGSDHQSGNAADFIVPEGHGQPWEINTQEAFHWLRVHKTGVFGQLILEDHRAHLDQVSKLWVHVSNPTAHHPGTGVDPNRILISMEPGHYVPWSNLYA